MIDEEVILLTMWVIYEHPRDFPDSYVARRWSVGRKGKESFYRPEMQSIAAKKLTTLYRKLPAGLIRLERDPHDDPVILEVWLE